MADQSGNQFYECEDCRWRGDSPDMGEHMTITRGLPACPECDSLHLKESRPYRPSNGTVGSIFEADHCNRCVKMPHSFDAKNQCQIYLRAMAFDVDDPEYPKQWRYVDGEPACTAFKSREEFNAERRRRLIASSGPDLFS